MAINTKDMTHGKSAKLIVGFALPLMAGNVCQQLYTLTDTAVVGQFVGVEALAALGTADWLSWMVLGIITGFTQGFGILMSQCFGAGDGNALRRTIAMSVGLTAVIALLVTGLSQVALASILGLLNTPANIFDSAVLYLRIYFGGIPIMAVYNLLSSMLRALGDGKTPLHAMLVASLINIALDLLFVVVFHWGIAGAAAATLIAQLAASIFCLRMVRHMQELHLKRSDFTASRQLMRHLARLGVPLAFQNVIISAGGLAVQYVVNSVGFIFVAGFTAANKLYGLLEIAAVSFGFAISTYTGQNLGANQYGRIRHGVRTGAIISVVTAASIGAIMLVVGKYLLALFISGEAEQAEQVMGVAYSYLATMSCALPILYILYVYRSALQGMGNTLLPMLSGILELVMRVSVAFTLPALLGQLGVFIAEPAAWLGAIAILVPAYYSAARKFPDKIMQEAK